MVTRQWHFTISWLAAARAAARQAAFRHLHAIAAFKSRRGLGRRGKNP